jgi:hypothetical protein
MSKVFSFRLDANNPREAQARDVIEAWVGDGYSLRYVIVDALLLYKKKEVGNDEYIMVMEQLQELILSLDKQPTGHPSNVTLPSSFINAVKNSAKSGLTSE